MERKNSARTFLHAQLARRNLFHSTGRSYNFYNVACKQKSVGKRWLDRVTRNGRSQNLSSSGESVVLKPLEALDALP